MAQSVWFKFWSLIFWSSDNVFKCYLPTNEWMNEWINKKLKSMKEMVDV